MKKILFILGFLVGFYSSFSQTFLTPRSSPTTTVQDSRLRSLLTFYYPHTHGLTLNGGLDTLGAVIYEDSSGHVWYRDTVQAGGHRWRMMLSFGDATGGVSSFNTRTGAVTLTSGDVTTALTYAPVNPNGTSSQYIAGDGSKVTFPTIPAQINITDAGLFTHTGTYPNYIFTGITPTQQQVFTQGATLNQNNFWVTGANVLGMTGTAAFGLPTGSTSQRPSSPGTGYFRFNTDSAATETFNGSIWVKTGSGTGTVVTGVTSFNTRTGAVVLGSSDVISALTYTPYNSTNPSAYISNITGLISPGANINITGNGTFGNPYVIIGTASGSVFNQDSIKHYFVDTGVSVIRNLYTLAWDSVNRKWIMTPPGSGGGGGGVSSFSFSPANGFTGSVSNPSTVPALTIGTSVTGLLFGNGTAMSNATVSTPLTYSAGTLAIQAGGISQNGYITSADWNTFNGKQTQLNGTGLVRASGTTITYDNSAYLTNITGLVTQGNHVTITGSGTTGSPYVINALDSIVLAGYGLTRSVSGTNIIFKLDTANIKDTISLGFKGVGIRTAFASINKDSLYFKNVQNGAWWSAVNQSDSSWKGIVDSAAIHTYFNGYYAPIGAIGSTNLSVFPTALGDSIRSSNGTSGFLPIANGTNAGALSPTDWTKLQHILTIRNYQVAGTDTIGVADADTLYLKPFQLTSSDASVTITNNNTANKLSYDLHVAGGSGNTNSNIGSGYRFAVPNTNNVKTLFCTGCTLDSTTNANALTLTVSGAGSQTLDQTLGFGNTTNKQILSTANMKGDSALYRNALFIGNVNIGDTNYNPLLSIYVIDNSIGVGSNASPLSLGYAGRLCNDYGWSTQFNRSISGTTIRQVTAGDSSFENRIPTIQNYNPLALSVAIIGSGINDLVTDSVNVKISLGLVVDAFITTHSWPRNLVVNYSPPYSPVRIADSVFVSAQRTICLAKGIIYVDIWHRMKALYQAGMQLVSSDSLHPTTLGHAYIEQWISQAIDSANPTIHMAGNLTVRGVTDMKGNDTTRGNLFAAKFIYPTGGLVNRTVNGGISLIAPQISTGGNFSALTFTPSSLNSNFLDSFQFRSIGQGAANEFSLNRVGTSPDTVFYVDNAKNLIFNGWRLDAQAGYKYTFKNSGAYFGAKTFVNSGFSMLGDNVVNAQRLGLYRTGNNVAAIGVDASGILQIGDGVNQIRLGSISTSDGTTFTPYLIIKQAGGVNDSSGKHIFASPTTSYASVLLPVGTAPSSPVTGDLYHVAGHLYFFDGATTYDLLNPSNTLTYTQAAINDTIGISNGNKVVLPIATSSLAGQLDTLRAKLIDSIHNRTFTGFGSSLTTVAFGSTPNANGGGISGVTLTLQPADGSNPGGVSTTAQTFSGVKTFSNEPVFPASTTSVGSLKISASLNDPTSPAQGEMWLNLNHSNLFFKSTNGSIVPIDLAGGVATYSTSTTLDNTAVYINFSGNSASTFTVPTSITYLQQRYFVKNAGTALLTFSASGSDVFVVDDIITAATSFVLKPGESVEMWGRAGSSWLVNITSNNTKYKHTIFTPTTGGTVALVNNQYNIVNPAGSLAALTVNLPSSPVNNDVVYIKFTQTVSVVTYGNGTVVSGVTAPVAGGLVVLTYDSGTTSWY